MRPPSALHPIDIQRQKGYALPYIFFQFRCLDVWCFSSPIASHLSWVLSKKKKQVILASWLTSAASRRCYYNEKGRHRCTWSPYIGVYSDIPTFSSPLFLLPGEMRTTRKQLKKEESPRLSSLNNNNMDNISSKPMLAHDPPSILYTR